MSELIKIGILVILGVMVALQFRAARPEYGIYMGLVMSIMIFAYAVRQFSAVLGQFTLIRQFLGSSQSYLSILLKITGVTYVCEFSAGICKVSDVCGTAHFVGGDGADPDLYALACV